MTAPYEAIINTTDDETFVFVVEPRTAAGVAPTWADYDFRYALNGNGINLVLNEGSGITIDEIKGQIIINAGASYRLQPGIYKHGLLMTQTTSKIAQQLFDGSVTVSQGNLP
jgi:hypothetical protein